MNNLDFNYINRLNDICILSWGELKNRIEIERICPKIIEAQKEEWQNKNTFFKNELDKIEEKYILLIDDKFELVDPQIYFFQCLSIFSEYKVITFIYSDFTINNRYMYMPSFQPYIGENIIFHDNTPIFVDNICKSLDVLDIKTLSKNKIGYHIPSPIFKYI